MVGEYKLVVVHDGHLHYAKVRLSLNAVTDSDAIVVVDEVSRDPSSHGHVSERWIASAVNGARRTLQAMKQRGDISGGWLAAIEDVAGLYADTEDADVAVASGQAIWAAVMPTGSQLSCRFGDQIKLELWDIADEDDSPE